MTTDEEFLKLARECGASLEGDGFPVNFARRSRPLDWPVRAEANTKAERRARELSPNA